MIARNTIACTFLCLFKNSKTKHNHRRAVALSCYIVPIMQWLTTMDDPINEFRIIQSELYFNQPKDSLDDITILIINAVS